MNDKTMEQLMGEPSERPQQVAASEVWEHHYKQLEAAFKESEKRYASLLESIPDGILVLDIETLKLQYANPAICRLSGYTEEELKAMEVSRFHPREALHRVISEIEAQLKREKTLAPEIPCLKKDGTLFYADINAIKLLINGRECLLGFFRDVTEQKETKKALEKSERLYRTLAENVRDVIWITDLNLRFTYVSPSVIQFLGYSANEVTARKVGEILTPSSFRVAMEAFAEALATEKSERRHLSKARTLELEHYCKDGSTVWAEVKMSFLRDEEGQAFGILGVSRDISKRKQAEDALQEKEAQYRGIFNSATDAFLIFDDPKGKLVEANPQACTMYGYSHDELITLSGRDLMHPDYHHLVKQFMSDVREKGTFQSEAVNVKKDGTPFHVEVRGTRFDYKGKNHLLAIVRDITERRKAEEALQKAHDELEIRVKERTLELAKANVLLQQEVEERKRIEEELKASFEKLKFFAYSVSHDLKNPAIGIHGLTKLLHKQYDDLLGEKGKNYCHQIVKASEQIASLVEKINVYMATKEAPLTIENLRLKEALQMVREEFSSQLNIRQIEWSEPESLPEVRGDRVAILRVLRNLIDNALKYGGDKLSEINIGYQEDDKFHILSVEDDGVGIKQEASKKIFGLFKRYETSRGIEGTGLGLAIVKEIAEQHGGRVWAEPGPKKGITFYISISKSLP